MPIYEYGCVCGSKSTEIQKIGADAPGCPSCGKGMTKRPTTPAMIKWKGDGGYPSMRKARHGTAPYTSGYGAYGD